MRGVTIMESMRGRDGGKLTCGADHGAVKGSHSSGAHVYDIYGVVVYKIPEDKFHEAA